MGTGYFTSATTHRAANASDSWMAFCKKREETAKTMRKKKYN